MATYRITNRTSGQDMGTYEADDRLSALDAMARAAGYRSELDAIESLYRADIESQMSDDGEDGDEAYNRRLQARIEAERADLDVVEVLTKMMTIVVKVDEENNAQAWWDAAREATNCPADLRDLVRGHVSEVTISLESLAWCQSLPGWSDGPEYAPTALTVEFDHGVTLPHDGTTEWADCADCGAHLDPTSDMFPVARGEWDGGCPYCGAPPERVGLKKTR